MRKKKIGKVHYANKDLGPTLNELLTYVYHNWEELELTNPEFLSVKGLLGKGKSGKQHLDAVMHRPEVLGRADDVRELRLRATPILKVIFFA